jgi:hypothetical protein
MWDVRGSCGRELDIGETMQGVEKRRRRYETDERREAVENLRVAKGGAENFIVINWRRLEIQEGKPKWVGSERGVNRKGTRLERTKKERESGPKWTRVDVDQAGRGPSLAVG